VTTPDGSITLHIQKDSPGGDEESNRLPSCGGPFRPIMRMYQPHEAFLSGTYALSAIHRVDVS